MNFRFFVLARNCVRTVGSIPIAFGSRSIAFGLTPNICAVILFVLSSGSCFAASEQYSAVRSISVETSPDQMPDGSVDFSDANANDEPVHSAFSRPPYIAQAVDFWRRIYADIDTQHGVIHDNLEPEWVYELYPLNSGHTPRRQQRDIDRRVRHYRQLLLGLANTAPSAHSSEQRRLYQLLGEPADPAVFSKAAKRLRFQRGQADRFRQGMQRQAKIGAVVNRVLAEHNLPLELAALPHVESSYNATVKSSAGALGLWQIMPATGRRYLQVSAKLDERLDIEASTRAAAKLLQHNYSVLQSWPLAITAYNRGLAGVRRAVKASDSRDIGEIARHYNGRSFGFASRNFYAEFLAAHDVSSGRYPGHASTQPVFRLTLNRFVSVFALQQAFNVSTVALKEVNPELIVQHWTGELYVPQGYDLRVPAGSLPGNPELTLRNIEALAGADRQQAERFYRIEKGDLLHRIAEAHQMDSKSLIRLNSLRNARRIIEGQILRVSQAGLNSYAAKPVSANMQSVARSLVGKDSVKQTQRGRMVTGVLPGLGTEAIIVQYAYAAMGVEVPPVWRPQSRPSARLPRIPGSLLAAPASADKPVGRFNSERQLVASAERTRDVPDLRADPADYLVDPQNSIEIQVGESLGHYAEWLELSVAELGALNELRSRSSVVVGKKLQLEFSNVSAREFERRRYEFHTSMQQKYFAEYRISGVHQHALSGGDSLWELAQSEYYIPFWLLRQYNPELDLASVLPLNQQLTIPLVTSKTPSV